MWCARFVEPQFAHLDTHATRRALPAARIFFRDSDVRFLGTAMKSNQNLINVHPLLAEQTQNIKLENKGRPPQVF